MPLIRRSGVTAGVVLAWAACGGRSELEVPPPVPPEPECDVTADCPGHDDGCEPVECVDPVEYGAVLPDLPAGVPLPPRVCAVVHPVECDDNDPCTADACEAGECTYGPSTFDLDGDEHRAPLPGTEPGEPGSCGDDCNDASELAFPGNTEVCDGVDNDCNGIVDDNASFVPLDDEPVRVDGDIAPAGPGGLGFNGESYLSIYTGTSDGFDMYQTRLLPDGTKVAPIEEKFTFQNADSAGGPIVWIGDRYGVAWQDRRDGNYEAYFAILGPDGAKAFPDTRLSVAAGFSVNVSLAWNGQEFIVAWQDDRDGLFQVMAQRVTVDAVPVGGNVPLSLPSGFEDEAPTIASGSETVAVTYTNGQAGSQTVRFQTFEQLTLEPRSEIVTVTDGQSEAVYPQIVWNDDRYVVAWFDRTGPLKAIFAATFDEDGMLLDGPANVSSPGSFRSRYPSMLPLGDRVLLVYADDRDGGDYELYTRMFDRFLAPITTEQRLTNAAFDSIYPISTFGPEGDVGILFRDDREAGENHVWFTRLGCVTAP
jgi:hypothetical protein